LGRWQDYGGKSGCRPAPGTIPLQPVTLNDDRQYTRRLQWPLLPPLIRGLGEVAHRDDPGFLHFLPLHPLQDIDQETLEEGVE